MIGQPRMTEQDEYARTAWIYAPLTAPFLRPSRVFVRGLIRGEAPGAVLDVCCGTGTLAGLVARDGRPCLGLDLSRAMLGRGGHAAMAGAWLVRGDATTLPFGDDSFQAVVTAFALHEKPETTRLGIIKEMVRVLSPGGLLAAVDYLGREGLRATAAQLAVMGVERAAGREHYRLFREFTGLGGIMALLRRAGLSPRLDGRFLLGGAGVAVARP